MKRAVVVYECDEETMMISIDSGYTFANNNNGNGSLTAWLGWWPKNMEMTMGDERLSLPLLIKVRF